MIPIGELEDDWNYEDDGGDLNCPNCGREYDEIDYEYQICHLCGFNNNPNPTPKEE